MFSTHWLLSLTVLLAAMAGNRLAAKEEWEQAEAPPLVSQLVVDRDAKTYGFLAEGARGPGVRNARWGLQVDGKVLWSSDATAADWQGPDDGHVTPAAPASMVLRFDRPKLEWTVRWSMLAENGVGVVSLTIKNLGPESVSLGKCYLADTSEENGLLDLGGNASATVVLASSGWSAPGRVQRVTALHTSRTVAQLYNPTSQTALQAGFLTFDRANTLHQVEWNQARLRPVLRSYCDFEGFALAAGAEMAGETLTLELSRNPLISLTHWADRAAEHYRPRISAKCARRLGRLGLGRSLQRRVLRGHGAAKRRGHREEAGGPRREVRLGQPRQHRRPHGNAGQLAGLERGQFPFGSGEARRRLATARVDARAMDGAVLAFRLHRPGGPQAALAGPAATQRSARARRAKDGVTASAAFFRLRSGQRCTASTPPIRGPSSFCGAF